MEHSGIPLETGTRETGGKERNRSKTPARKGTTKGGETTAGGYSLRGSSDGFLYERSRLVFTRHSRESRARDGLMDTDTCRVSTRGQGRI